MFFPLSDKKYIYWDWVCTTLYMYTKMFLKVHVHDVGKLTYFVFMKDILPKCHFLSIDLKENNYFYSKCQNNIFLVGSVGTFFCGSYIYRLHYIREGERNKILFIWDVVWFPIKQPSTQISTRHQTTQNLTTLGQPAGPTKNE